MSVLRSKKGPWKKKLLPIVSAATCVILTATAAAQPGPRGAPVLRTPPPLPARTGVPAGTGSPAAGALAPLGAPRPNTSPTPTPAPAPGGSATPNGGGTTGTPAGGSGPVSPGASPAGLTGNKAGGATGDDPMAAVKQGAKDIEFKPKPPGTKVKFNMNDADLAELVTAISNITGKRFIYGGKLRSIKATTVCPEDITIAEAYSAFLSILDANGMTVVPHGRFLKIVETPGIVTETTPIYGPATPVPDEERYVTRMYRLQHIDAQEASTVLSKFKTKEGDISVYSPSNLLIITEPASNVQRMLRIVEEIDVGGAGDQLYVEPLHYVSAAELATKLNEILGLNKGGGGAPGAPGAPGAKATGARIIADDRGNALVMVANDGDYNRLLELIKVMDVKQTGEGEIHVHKLQFASCNQTSGQSPQPGMLQTLQQLTGGGTGARPGGAGTPGLPSNTPGAAGRPGAAGAAQDEVFEGRIRMSCDDATNALITISSARDWSQLFPVIEQLDRPRRQVFIEAVIMDVSVDRSTDFGLAFHGGAPIDFSNGKQGLFYGGNNILGSIAPQNLEALALGVRGPDIDGSTGLLGTGVSIPALGVALNAMAKDGDTNVLATPHILATDNTPADIQIGQNIPLQTNVGGFGGLAGLAGQAAGAQGAGALAGLLGGGALGGQAQRQDVGTKIKVTPHVNDSDQVRLELQEEISEAGSPLGNLGAIPINKRTANTTLVVRDQQTVVIGGLVRDSVTNGETKIPVLGDIPLIGFLFKQTTKKKQKTNLLLVLTPYVIRDQDDLRAIFERKMQERQEFLDRYFVFSENQAWEPPHDYQRSNGLVEDIRQSLMAEQEKERMADELKLKPRKTHEARPPIALPAMGSRSAGTDNAAATPVPGGEKRPAPMVPLGPPKLAPPSGAPQKVE